MLTSENLEKFVVDYSYFYCAENKYDEKGKVRNEYNEKKQKYLGKRVRLGCSTKEVEQIAYDAVAPTESSCTKITREHIAWKAGRLKVDEKGQYTWDGKNGMGNTIINVDSYLEKINENSANIIEMLDRGDVKSAYEKLLCLNRECEVKQLGAVYMITLIFFLSKGKYPIYDKFAHKAVKAICFDKNPLDISVDPAPDKSEVNKVLAMYDEYCGLLTKTFKKRDLSREQDQALWVYGHSKVKYPRDNE